MQQGSLYWQEAHESLSGAWDLLKHHLTTIDSNSFTEEDLVLYTENFQKVISKSTVSFLEKDFAKQVMNLQVDHSQKPLPDKFSKYEFFVRDLLTVKLPEDMLELVRGQIYVDQDTE